MRDYWYFNILQHMYRWLSRREAEAIASRWIHWKTKMIAGTLYHNLVAYWTSRTYHVMKELYDLNKLCNDSDFIRGCWEYEWYYFNGRNFDYEWLDYAVLSMKDVTSPVWWMHGIEEMHKLIHRCWNLLPFQKAQSKQDQKKLHHTFDQNPMAFRANPKINQAILDFMEVMLPEKFRFTEWSLENLAGAIKTAKEQHLNVNFIGNHAWNLDAWVREFLMHELRKIGVLAKNDERWFLCGIWMQLNNSTRKYALWTNNLLTYGISDTKHLRDWWKRESTDFYNADQMKQWREDFDLSKMLSFDQFAVARKEHMILFPHGKRWSFWWLEESMDRRIAPYFHQEWQLFIPVHIAHTDDAMPLWNGLLSWWYKYFKAQSFLEVDIAPFFLSKEKSVSQVHDIMVEQRNILQPERRGIEEPYKKYQLLQKMSSLQNWWEKSGEDICITKTEEELMNILATTIMWSKAQEYMKKIV